MKKLFTILLISLWTLQAYSQKLKKTYYDLRQTQLMEEYYINSAGYGNGLYKKYKSSGALLYKGTYKDGSREGEWITYSSYTGKLTEAQKETYKDDKLNGSAIYYNTEHIATSKGSYLNGEKDGKWTYVKFIDNTEFYINGEVEKGGENFKFDKIYEKGIVVPMVSGEEKIYYHPSGKISSIVPYSNGLINGECKYYFLTGKIKSLTNYKDGKPVGESKAYYSDGTDYWGRIHSEEGNLLMEFIQYPNGKVKEYSDWRNGVTVYEGYDENGNPNRKMELAQSEKRKEQEKIIRDNAIKAADKLLYDNKYEESIAAYTELGINVDYLKIFNELMSKYNSGSIGIANVKGKLKDRAWNLPNSVVTIQQHKDYCSKVIEEKMNLENELKQLNNNVINLIKSYDKVNVEQKETMLVDGDGKPVMKDSYLKGKFLYLKSKIIIDQYFKEFQEEVSIDKKKTLSNKLFKAVDILNKIPESDWKDLNKQLKKVDDPEQIKTILKI